MLKIKLLTYKGSRVNFETLFTDFYHLQSSDGDILTKIDSSIDVTISDFPFKGTIDLGYGIKYNCIPSSYIIDKETKREEIAIYFVEEEFEKMKEEAIKSELWKLTVIPNGLKKRMPPRWR